MSKFGIVFELNVNRASTDSGCSTYYSFLKMILLLILIESFNCHLFGQTLTGSTGLVTIPTADMPDDGELSLGASIVNKKYNVRFPGQYNQFSFYSSVGYLPFLEISLRITRQLRSTYKEPLGDRMPSIRFRCLRETIYYPSVVLGVHDFMWAFGGTNTVHYNALYLTIAKHFEIINQHCNIGLYSGYGLDCIPAAHHEFVGYFGGASLLILKTVNLQIEYDTKKVNGGIQLCLFNHIQTTFAFLGLNTFSFGCNFKFNLHSKFFLKTIIN